MDEYLDLTNENNQPTGEKELRSVVHLTGLWHRTVHIYLFRMFNEKLEFLVHLRSKNKDLHPNCWDTRFGGHIKAGESLEKGVMHELEEELGLEVDTSKLIEGEYKKSDHYPNREFCKVFYFKYNNPIEDLSFNDGEVQEIKWLSVDEIIKSMEEDSSIWAGSKVGFQEILNSLHGIGIK